MKKSDLMKVLKTSGLTEMDNYEMSFAFSHACSVALLKKCFTYIYLSTLIAKYRFFFVLPLYPHK